LEEIPDILSKHAQPMNQEAYKNWPTYLNAFLSLGGIFEAHPPSDSVTSLTVSMLIEPNANIKIVSSGDHIRAELDYSCAGYSMPQSSIECNLLNDACIKVAESCKQRNIYGYVDVDFVTFIDIKTVMTKISKLSFSFFLFKSKQIKSKKKFIFILFFL
jgi:IQ domain-containing protein H